MQLIHFLNFLVYSQKAEKGFIPQNYCFWSPNQLRKWGVPFGQIKVLERRNETKKLKIGILPVIRETHQLHRSTSRERPKSAPYLRLKNSKRISKCQSILFYSTGKTQKLNRIVAPEGTLWDFSSILSQIKKNWGRGIFGEKNILKKVSQCRKNWKGTLWDFSTSVLSENSKKIEGGTLLGFFFRKMSHSAENTLRQYPLVPQKF